MHVSGVSLDLNWFLQLILTVFFLVFGLLHLVKNTAHKYFEVDANFETAGGEGERGRQGRVGEVSDRTSSMSGFMDDAICIVCRNSGSKKCSRCKSVRYCSQKCQEVHWKSGHKTECKELQSSSKVNSTATVIINKGVKGSTLGSKTYTSIALVPARGTSKPVKSPKDVLFPYDEFVKLFYWDKHQFPPCGLLNCGNSCFANVVLQCLTFTRPLVAHLLEKGHRTECIRDDWCFLCEFQTHVERASQSVQSFSPNNIISRLPNIGGNLGYGRQEDAHEFMRFAIDTMQLVCLDEFGGEKAVPPQLQETTIIQHIYGGHLQSQVICNNCNNISNQYENMMDLTVEIHGGAASLEECLDLFTAMEWLHGDNMYKCDGCNNYVRASKRLTVKQAPNILTIALKRFQSGRFGKLNKKVTFPETLNLRPYMSKAGDDTNIYKLYAVVVHVDVLNASFFGHYICYIKDLSGNWYRIDDCKVVSVELDEVLSQGAYMILYSRVCPRPSSLQTGSKKDEPKVVSIEKEACQKQQNDSLCSSGLRKINGSLQFGASSMEIESSESHPESLSAHLVDTDMVDFNSSTPKAVSKHERSSEAGRENANEMDSFLSSNGTVREHSEGFDPVISQPSSSKVEVGETKVYGNGHLHSNEITSHIDNTNKLSSNNHNDILMSETSAVEANQTNHGSPCSNGSLENGNGAKQVESRCGD